MLQLTIDQNVDQFVNNEQRRSAVKFPEKVRTSTLESNHSYAFSLQNSHPQIES